MKITATGDVKVTRQCAITGCGITINAPARLCGDHWQNTPIKLREDLLSANNDAPGSAALQAIVDHWARA